MFDKGTSFPLCIQRSNSLQKSVTLKTVRYHTNKAFSTTHLFDSFLVPTLQSFSLAPVSFFSTPHAAFPRPLLFLFLHFFLSLVLSTIFFAFLFPLLRNTCNVPSFPSILLCTSPLISPVSPYIQNNKLKYFSSSFCFC
jgi:hypothetical protein